MPHSLRAKLSGLRYKKIISDKDYDRLCKALDNEGVLGKIRAEIEHEREEAYKMLGSELGFDKMAAYDKCIGIIDRHLQEAQE